MCGTMDATLLELDTHQDADLQALVAELQEEISQLRREASELRREAGYWKSRHADAVKRNRKLQEELDQATAEIRKLKADLFGSKSEKQSSTDRSNDLDDPQDQNSADKKKRGQQPNRPGPARRDYSHLSVREQFVDVPPQDCVCGRCGKPLWLRMPSERRSRPSTGPCSDRPPPFPRWAAWYGNPAGPRRPYGPHSAAR